jgi:hypothetical protein
MLTYQKKIRLYKISLWCTLLLVITFLFVSTNFNKQLDNQTLQSDEVAAQVNGKDDVFVNEPELFGYDAKDLPFKVHAKQGKNLSGNHKRFNDVSAEFASAENNKIKVKSNYADIDIEAKTIKLFDDVELNNLTGKYQNKLATGQGDVVLESENGKIESAKFDLLDDYSVIKFYGGRVKTTLYNSEQNE